jgi:GDP-L-fucose synthase
MERYDSKDIGEFGNIGVGEDLKIKDLANLVKEVVGFDGGITWDASKPDGTPRKLLDVSRIQGLGWRNNISLRDGIATTYQWYGSALDSGS